MTFEEFMAQQGLNPTTPEVGTLADWRVAYEETCEILRRTPPVGSMALRLSPAEHLYGVAVEDEAGCWLALWVKRSPKGEYFVFLPRADGAWNAHASWHVDGTFHQKSHGHRMIIQKRQRPNGLFTGSENMMVTPLSADAHTVGAIYRSSDFDGAVVVSASSLRGGQHLVSVDLAQAGHREIPAPGSRLVDQRVFGAFVPQVVVTLWKSVYALAVP